jgi:asparagine synthase (glutamine-hydrolysing)
MCGIAGIVNFDGFAVSPQAIKTMTTCLKHRGPDDEGHVLLSSRALCPAVEFRDPSEIGNYSRCNIALGHRRLSIIDLSEAGHQPMSNEDGSVWIVFNGEVYNFQEIREDLGQHKFRSRSDTEVILHAYEEWGIDAVKKFNGMFAFVLLDLRLNRLFLVRDRIGKKPLYYFQDGKRLIFASELKAILSLPDVPRELDPNGAASYFSHGYIPSPRTILKTHHKLEPGHVFSVDLGGTRQNKVAYWSLQVAPDYETAEEEWCEAIRDLLLDATRLRLVSDVPVGAFLSGGIDSGSVVAMMAQSAGNHCNTFTIGFEEEEFSELENARAVAQRWRTNHKEKVLRPDALSIFSDLVYQYDEPFADSSAIPTFYVCGEARKHVTVALSGDGGDELFAGYKNYFSSMQDMRFDVLPDFLKRLLRVVYTDVPYLRYRSWFARAALPNDEFYCRHKTTTFDPVFRKKLFQPEFYRQVEDFDDFDLFRSFYRQGGKDPLTAMEYLDVKTYLPEDILTKVDRASMYHSLEVRIPLLDYRLVELAFRIPSTLKLRNGEKKAILRKAMKDFLPEPVLQQKKMGFAVPLAEWFERDMHSMMIERLTRPDFPFRDWFNQDIINYLIENPTRFKSASQIWSLLVFDEWCQRYL